ncbi:DUF4178 domain-containing protein [Rhodobacteraceae bacterium]|nr:DUF4178 domain-containing protein [Paracoccaceae bacterium]
MNEAADQTHSLNCTQCGAGLDVLGGGRVKTHICSYCGAELDAQDDYKVIQQFRDMKRPDTPFDLGMTGQLWGVEFTIIGTMAWTEYYEDKRWTWVDHQVYSPTHGYGWLTVDKGYVTYTRKTREIPSPPFISNSTIEHNESRPLVKFQGETFQYFSSGTASPTFIEGEFNYRPSLDDSVRYVELMGSSRMLDIVQSGREREYEVTELPDQAALLSSFGVATNRRPRQKGTHPLENLVRSSLQLFTRNVALIGAAVAVVLGIGLSAKGEQIARSGQTAVSSEITLPFEVTDDTGLTEITIEANANNSWAWFETELTDAEDEPVAAFERGIEYYSGSDWKEGSRKARTRLTLPTGTYTLYLSMTEAKVDWTGGRLATNMSVTVRQGVAQVMWVFGAATFLGLIGFLFLGQRFLHHQSRWSGSDWSDD